MYDCSGGIICTRIYSDADSVVRCLIKALNSLQAKPLSEGNSKGCFTRGTLDVFLLTDPDVTSLKWQLLLTLLLSKVLYQHKERASLILQQDSLKASWAEFATTDKASVILLLYYSIWLNIRGWYRTNISYRTFPRIIGDDHLQGINVQP